MKKTLSRFMAILFIILLLPFSQAFAFSRPKHDDITENILFGKDGLTVKASSKANEVWERLTTAAYICIDLHNASDKTPYEEDKLTKLANAHGFRWWLFALPSSVKEITVGGNDHRKYTHRGWDYNFQANGLLDKANWSKRKLILQASVSFDFGFTFRSIFGHISPIDPQCNAFCELIYFSHILGDHQEAMEKHKEVSLLGDRYIIYQESADIAGMVSIIEGLVGLGDSLFLESSDNWKTRLKVDLTSLANEFQTYGTTMDTYYEFQQYEASYWKLLNALEEKLPGLLMKEPFFSKVFQDGSN